MDNNESHLLQLLDNKHYQEAVDFIFTKKDFAKNDRIKSLSLIGKEELLNLFQERGNYLQSVASLKKKAPSYKKFLMLAKFSEEFNILEDMVVDQALSKVGISSLDDFMDQMDGIFAFSSSDNKLHPFIKAKDKTYDTVANFVKNREWNQVERRLKPR